MRDLHDPITARPAEIFQSDWRVYRKLVVENHLFHREAHAALAEIARQRFQGPWRFLDLACGDARSVAPALAGTGIAAYHGVDTSAVALILAAANLARLDCPVLLDHADLRDVLDRYARPVDLAWIGLSLHHFDTAAKRAILTALRRIVGPGGAVAFYENTLIPGEDRAGWLDRWDAQRPAWTGFDDADWRRMTDHVHDCDLPESEADWRQLALDAGFTAIDERFRAPSDLFRLYLLS